MNDIRTTGERRTRFYRDKANAKWLGVCAGIADYTGVDTVFVRVGFVVLTVAFGWPLLAYIVLGLLAPSRSESLYIDRDEQRFWQNVRQSPARTARDVRSRFREIDRRLADVEAFYTSSNRQLADEIERLR